MDSSLSVRVFRPNNPSTNFRVNKKRLFLLYRQQEFFMILIQKLRLSREIQGSHSKHAVTKVLSLQVVSNVKYIDLNVD